MEAATLFQAANTAALTGWIALLAHPFAPGAIALYAGRILPLGLSVLYAGLVLAFWSSSEGNFGSLPDVMRLFDRPEIALAGWVHYLAFDLFVGAWIAGAARTAGIPFMLVIPCLALTFLFGPAGLLTYLILRTAMRRPAEKE